MYIITEDSNSARDFWQCVAQTFKGFIAHDFVKWGTRLCMKKGAEFVATSYWCFEDLYLSYDEVLAMYLKNPVAENVVIAALQYVHDNLQNGTDYFDTSREIQNFIDLHNSAGKTENTLQTNC